MTLTGMDSNYIICGQLVNVFVDFADRGDKTYAKVLEQVLGLVVDVQLASLGEVESGNLGDELVLALTLLLLKLEGDTTDGSTLNTLHQVGGVTGNL